MMRRGGDARTHRRDPGGRHLLEEALRAGGVEAVDGVPAVLLRAQLDRLHVLVAVLADLQRSEEKEKQR